MKSESTEAACDEEPEGWEGLSMVQRTLHAINAGDVMSETTGKRIIRPQGKSFSNSYFQRLE